MDMINEISDRLFSYPFIQCRKTFYQELGITPGASPAEIRKAKNNLKAKLNKQKKEKENLLQGVYDKVNGLPDLYTEIESIRHQGKDGDAEILRKNEKTLIALEQKACSINPDYKILREQCRELQEKINEINKLKLENEEERYAYDKEHPPCALLKLEKDEHSIFTPGGRRLALFLLRLELSGFIEENGEACFHPSDLTRKEYINDFTYNKLLDEGK
jgi:hypothetical protein